MAFVSFSTTLGKALAQGLFVVLVFLSHLPFSVTSIILIAVALLLLQFPYVGSLAVLPYVYGSNLLTFFGLLRRQTTWCVVYDSQTKLPIDPAYITVRDMQGKEVSTIITDLSGRFSLLLPRGLYFIEASKTNYIFPSVAVAGSETDGKYTNLYFGTIIEIEDEERSVAVSIPMDPVGEDWNQVEKKRKDLFYQFEDKDTYFHAAKAYMAIALMLTIIQSFYQPSTASLHRLETVTVIALLVLWYTWNNRQYAHSFVLDKKTGLPVAFARVSIYSARTNTKVSQKTTSFEGQFTCLLSRGSYYVTIEKRNDQGGYELAYTSGRFSVTSGYIGKRFTI